MISDQLLWERCLEYVASRCVCTIGDFRGPIVLGLCMICVLAQYDPTQLWFGGTH